MIIISASLFCHHQSETHNITIHFNVLLLVCHLLVISEPVVPSAPMESERDIHVQNEESNNTNVMDYGVSSGVPIAQAVAIDAPEPYVPHASNSMNNNNNNNQATVIDSSNVQQSPMVVAATAVPQAATSTTTTTSYTVVRTTIMHACIMLLARKVLFPSVSERQSKIFLTRFPSFWSC